MTTSPIASAIRVTLDKPRTLILDFNAFVAYREQTGTELPDDVAALFQRDEKGALVLDKNDIPVPPRSFSTSQLRAITWAGLVHEEESLTIKQVGRFMTARNVGPLTLAIYQSLGGQEEPADPTPADATENPSPGAGSESDPSANSNLALVKKKRSGG